MFESIASTALVVGVGILGFILRGFVGSYFSEKGKNLATQEDVAHITSQIENVKASIQTLAQLKTDYEQQRRQWLLSFYDSSVEMLYEKFGTNFGDLPYDNGKSLFEFQQSFKGLVSQIVKKYQRIVLYFEHQEPLTTSAEKLLNLALQAESVFKIRFGRIKLTLTEEADALTSGDYQRVGEAVEKSDEANRIYWEDMRPIVENFREALRQYLSLANQFLKETSEIYRGKG